MAVLNVFTSARAALEATRGTDLTPTRLIYAEEFVHVQEIQTVRPEEHRGSYFPVYGAAPGPELNTFQMSGRLTYQMAAWLGNVFIAPVLTPTGAGPYTFAFTPSGTTDNVKTVTLQLGDAQAIGATTPGVKLNYLMGQSLNLHWEKSDDGAVTFDAQFVAASSATQLTAFTGSLSDYTTEPVSAVDTTVYVDSTTIGTTADDYVTAIDWTLELGPVPFYTLNGSYAPLAVYRPDYRRWTASITRQYANKTEWDAYAAKTTRKVRIDTSPSASYGLTLDLYGTWTGPRDPGDVDGIVTEVLTLEPVYDATATTDFKATVINDLATMS